MKIFIKLKDFQHTVEVDNVSINCVNGNIVISETIQLEAEKSEEPVREVNQPEHVYESSQAYRTSFQMIVKLIKAGYSMVKIGEYTGIPGWKIRRINKGTDSCCKYYASNGIYKFPIREMPETGFRQAGDNVRVTICKECGEPIPMQELLFDPQKQYCDKCEKQLMSDTVDSKKKPKKAWAAKYENPKLASEAIKLLKLGYSITQVAKSLDIHYMVISRINNGEQHYREDFPNEKFPIQDNKSCKGMYSSNVWRRVPVTFCKECGEPIPLADLLKNPRCGYCPDCRAKHKEE